MIMTFDILSTRVRSELNERKYVTYLIQITRETDLSPIHIERRYTDFLDLYRALRKDFPTLLQSVTFPRKVILGNFSDDVVAARRVAFEKFLRCVAERDELRNSPSLRVFLVGPEDNEAHKLLLLQRYQLAKPLLTKVFHLLNKLLTDRHPAVLLALCKLVACCDADPASLVEAERYAELALKRFETVSDIDLLRFYVPLLQICAKLWINLGKDRQFVENRLLTMKRQGHRVDECPKLLDAVLSG